MIAPVGIAFALIVLAIIITLLLRRQLREKYAVLWLVIGLATLVLAVFPELLVWLAGVLGVAVPSNLLFALSLALLIGVTLHLSWELSTAEEEIRRVAEDVAILRADVEALQARAPAPPEDPRSGPVEPEERESPGGDGP
jgi:hypothetical protein